MRTHSLSADEQLVRDVRLRQATRKKAKHLELARGQTLREQAWRRHRPPQKPANPCDQFVDGERLHHVVVGTEHQTGGAIERLLPLG